MFEVGDIIKPIDIQRLKDMGYRVTRIDYQHKYEMRGYGRGTTIKDSYYENELEVTSVRTNNRGEGLVSFYVNGVRQDRFIEFYELASDDEFECGNLDLLL